LLGRPIFDGALSAATLGRAGAFLARGKQSQGFLATAHSQDSSQKARSKTLWLCHCEWQSDSLSVGHMFLEC